MSYKRTNNPKGRPKTPPGEKLKSYPFKFWEIAATAASGKIPEPWIVDNPMAAVSVRQRFHVFRRLLIEVRHEHADAANNLMLHLKDNVISFSDPFGEIMAQAPELPPDATFNYEPGDGSLTVNSPKIDHGEKAVEDFLKQGRAPDVAAEAAKPCEHTWGMYNCLKCGKPRVDDAG